MSRQIIIIGGGISGLAVLHYLQKRFGSRPDVHLRLLEQNSRVGGAIQSQPENGCLFEAGPNGFGDSKPTTLELVEELGLKDRLIVANPRSRLRYISLRNQLQVIPLNPVELLRFQPLSFRDKLRIFAEMFIPKGRNPDETVFEFGRRRFGENFVKYFFDPMVSGIFAGDAQDLNLKSAFPRIYELEQKYGSLIKGMLSMKRNSPLPNPPYEGEGKMGGDNEKFSPPLVGGVRGGGKGAGLGGQLCSFQNGMSELVQGIFERYRGCVQLDEEVRSIVPQGNGFAIDTARIKYFADELFLCVTAYGAARLAESWAPALAGLLAKIAYVPIAVIGLVYRRSDFSKVPEGFGYLIPSSEGKEALGVIFASNIFAGRAEEGNVLLQIMMGGAHHHEVAEKNTPELFALAEAEIRQTFQVSAEPIQRFEKILPRAIPQYNREYSGLRKRLDEERGRYPHLHLAANYLDGIAVNDCIQNAKIIVEKISI